MKILVLDQDQNRAEKISQRLEIQGHSAVLFTNWDEALRELGFQEYSIVLLDSRHLLDSKHNLLNMRRVGRGYLYVIGMGLEIGKDINTLGINAVLSDASDLDLLEKGVDTASHFILQLKQLGNEAEDFPSAGGVIAKSAFNQLLLGSIDRAGRYGEESSVLFFTIENYKNIVVEDNEYSALHASARLAYHLSQTRRQSDILAQVGENEYAILFVRPEYDAEPVEATNRFAKTLSHIKDYTTGLCDVEISLRLYKIPSGALQEERAFTVKS